MFEEVPRVRRGLRGLLRPLAPRWFGIGPFAIEDDVALVAAAGKLRSSIAGPVSWQPTLSPTG
jgi:hypothetical protein